MLGLRGNLKIDAPNRRSVTHGSRPQPNSGENGQVEQQHCTLALERIVPDPHNQRETLRHMEGLSASIKAVGLIEPLIVTPDAEHDGLFRILSGHRRYEAAMALGLEEVEVVIRKPIQESLRQRQQLIANIQREELWPMELAQALLSMLQDGWASSHHELAEMLGKDKTWVSRAMRVLDLPRHIQEKVAAGQLFISARLLGEISGLTDQAAQEQLIDMLLSGATSDAVRIKMRKFQRRPRRIRARRAFATSCKCRVIVESKTADLPRERVIAALREALAQAEAPEPQPIMAREIMPQASAAADSEPDPPVPLPPPQKARKLIRVSPQHEESVGVVP